MLMWVNLFTHKASGNNFKGVKIVVKTGSATRRQGGCRKATEGSGKRHHTHAANKRKDKNLSKRNL